MTLSNFYIELSEIVNNYRDRMIDRNLAEKQLTELVTRAGLNNLEVRVDMDELLDQVYEEYLASYDSYSSYC